MKYKKLKMAGTIGLIATLGACLPAPKVATGDSRVEQAETQLQAKGIITHGQSSTSLWDNTEITDDCDQAGAKVAYVVGPNEAIQTTTPIQTAAYFMGSTKAVCLDKGAGSVFFVKFAGTDLTYYGGSAANTRWNQFWSYMTTTYNLPVKTWDATPYLVDGVHLNAAGKLAFATWLDAQY